tara:strand:+ start:199 stop:666 length:468 start_codon:yes stop_codon:yes gene_type:complete
MSEIKSWFEEAEKVFNCGEYEFTIVGGFKITHYFEDNSYSIQDTRFNDFYSKVSEPDLKVIQENGFIKGASILMYRRNVRRVEKYLTLIQKLYKKREDYSKLLGKSRVSIKNQNKYTKGIKNCNFNIHNYNDLMHFYKSKAEQFENNKQVKNKTL